MRRVNTAMYASKRVFHGLDEYIRIDALVEARKASPPQLKRCVRAIVKDRGISKPSREDLSSAFAICTKQLQRTGYFKIGTSEPTKKGLKRGRSKAADKEHGIKVAEYEKMLSAARGDNEK
jgi:hypothetical protein